MNFAIWDLNTGNHNIQIHTQLQVYQWRVKNAMISQITRNLTVCLTDCSYNSKRDITVLDYCPFLKGIHQWPMDFPYADNNGKVFSCEDIIMCSRIYRPKGTHSTIHTSQHNTIQHTYTHTRTYKEWISLMITLYIQLMGTPQYILTFPFITVERYVLLK